MKSLLKKFKIGDGIRIAHSITLSIDVKLPKTPITFVPGFTRRNPH